MEAVLFRRFLHVPFGGDEGQVSKHLLPNRGYFELHEVLSQGACLVTEDVLNLSKLLVQRCTLYINSKLPPLTEHEFVIVDEVLLDQLDYLDRNDQRNRDHRVYQHEICEEDNDRVHWRRVLSPVDVVIGIDRLVSKYSITNRSHNAENNLNQQDNP